DEVLDKAQRAAGCGVVRVRDAPRTVRAVKHVAVADHATPNPGDQFRSRISFKQRLLRSVEPMPVRALSLEMDDRTIGGRQRETIDNLDSFRTAFLGTVRQRPPPGARFDIHCSALRTTSAAPYKPLAVASADSPERT